MKDFNNVFNQDKEIKVIGSAKYDYGKYNWSIQADVKKYKEQADGDLWFNFYLHCEADDKTHFSLFANVNFFILNKD